MIFFGLITADAALSHAIAEQLKLSCPDIQHATFTSLEDALGAWGEALPPLIFWDAGSAAATEEMVAFFISRLTDLRPEPFVMTLGDCPPALEKWGVSERFARPLRLGYFLGRLQFYKRQLERAPDVETILGAWRFAPRGRLLTHQETGATVKLTDKEAALLDYLCQAQEPASREDILAALWGYEADLDTHTLETHIYRLRRKLMPPEFEGEDVFQTATGGYQIHPSWRGGAPA